MFLNFEKVFERDIDMLLINKFVNDKEFLRFFLDKVTDQSYCVSEIEHSLSDVDGESDVTVILENETKKIALLIEDKIDAIAMPMQRDRYNIRGQKGIDKGDYDEFFVFIVAPMDYLNTNEESKKYENRISYEELVDLLKNDEYAVCLLKQAIEEKKKGYVIIENENVTLFWKQYYKYVKEFYPSLKINEIEGPRGGKACWPHIITPVKEVYISHKSDRGFLDLTFNGMGEHYSLFMKCIKELLPKDMSVHKTNKSMAIRVIVPIIDFKKSFMSYVDEMKFILDSAMRLLELLEVINVKQMYELAKLDNVLKYLKN